MKLLIDMNLSPRWVDWFARAGIDAVHWSRVGAKDAPDSEIMAYAHEHAYVVLTHDLDFSAMLAATHREKPSVIQVRAQDISPESIGRQVIIALQQMASELDAGALLAIDPTHTRLRVLPLTPRD